MPFSGIAPDADAVRVVANDPILSSDQWLAFTPPRVPKLQSLNSFLGSQQPILEDWAVGLQFPCQRPFYQRDGVAEPPNYRILPDRPLAVSSTDTWQAEENGGINGWAEMLAQGDEVPTYLKNNWDRDWGQLQRYDPYFRNVPQAEPRNRPGSPGGAGGRPDKCGSARACDPCRVGSDTRPVGPDAAAIPFSHSPTSRHQRKKRCDNYALSRMAGTNVRRLGDRPALRALRTQMQRARPGSSARRSPSNTPTLSGSRLASRHPSGQVARKATDWTAR